MAQEFDIFNPQVSAVARGLESKVILIYGHNNVGKTFQSVRMKKPYVIACESGLNGIAGVPYGRVNNWADFKKIVKQFTSKSTVEKAREMYSTLIIDEVYASSLFCQDFVISTYGNGALTLGDQAGKINLYQMYEKEYFKMVNLLVSAGYTVVFIAHEDVKEGYAYPKGDKRCINPIIDACDLCVYLKANGMDEAGAVIPSSAYLAESDTFFARSRFTKAPTCLPVFTAEALEEAIVKAIEAEEAETGIKTVSYEEQKKMNTSAPLDYDALIDELSVWGGKLVENNKMELLTELVEQTLGAGQKVSNATKKQVEALAVILEDIKSACADLGIE